MLLRYGRFVIIVLTSDCIVCALRNKRTVRHIRKARARDPTAPTWR
jgi:hypothetical protein